MNILVEICSDAVEGGVDPAWEKVTRDYNQRIGMHKMDAAIPKEKKARYTFALMQHVKVAFSQLMERERTDDVLSIVGDELKRWYLNLRVQLKDSGGHAFWKAVPVGQGGTQDVGAADASAGSSMEHDPKYAESMYGRGFSPPDGQWTEDLIKQRLQVLEEVEWCAKCGEICKVKEGEGWRVYGEKHESAARSIYHPFCDKKMPLPQEVRRRKREVQKERKSLLLEMKKRKSLKRKETSRTGRRQLYKKWTNSGRSLSSVTVKKDIE